jgi:hypothetical protein
MYTILVNNDNSLTTSVRERIVQRSKLVDTLHFLVPVTYKNFDMREFKTVNLEYVLPVSREAKSELLTPSDELYKGQYIEYKLPLDTSITREAGNIELKLTFIRVEMDVDGNVYQYVRRTTSANMTVVACTAWCDVIPDQLLSAMDQRLIAMESMVRALDEESQLLYESKADNIKYNSKDNTLRLTANGEDIGDEVTLKTYEEALKDGVPVVDFGSETGKDETTNESDDVVEF